MMSQLFYCCTKFHKNLEEEFQDILEFMRKVKSKHIITYL